MPRLSSQQQLVCSLAVARVVLASLKPGEAVEDAIKRIRRSFILHAAGLSYKVEEGRDALQNKIKELEEHIKLKELEITKAKKVYESLLAETEVLRISAAKEASVSSEHSTGAEQGKDEDGNNKGSGKGKEKAKKGAIGKKKGAIAVADPSKFGPPAASSASDAAVPSAAALSKVVDGKTSTAKDPSKAVPPPQYSSQTSSSGSSAKPKSTNKKAAAQAAQVMNTKPEVILLESFLTRYGRVGLADLLKDNRKSAQHAFDGLKTLYELKHLHTSLSETHGTAGMLLTVKDKALLLVRSAKEGVLQLSFSTKENMPPNPLSESKTWLKAAQRRKAATAAALQAEKAKNGAASDQQKDKADGIAEFSKHLKDRMKSLACFILAVLGLVCEIVDDEKWGIGKDVEQAKAEMVCLISSEIGEILHLLISLFPLATEYGYRTLLAPLPKEAVDPLAIYTLASKTSPSVSSDSMQASNDNASLPDKTGRVANVDIRPLIGSLILSICNVDEMKSLGGVKKSSSPLSTLSETKLAVAVSRMALWQTRYGLLKVIHTLLQSERNDPTASSAEEGRKTLVKSKTDRLEKIIKEACAQETLLGLTRILDAVSDMTPPLTASQERESENARSAALNGHQRRELLHILQECESYIRERQSQGEHDPVVNSLMNTLSKVASSFGSQLLEEVMATLALAG